MATPALAGRVIDAIVESEPISVVLEVAGLIAVIAVVEAGLGIVNRWQSARIGEGLILNRAMWWLSRS